MRFSQTAVNRHWEQLAQTALHEPIVFNLGVPLDTLVLAPMLNFVKYLCASLDGDNTLSDTPLALQAESYLLSSLLLLAPHNETNALQATGRRSLLPRSVRRAQEFMSSHAMAPLSITDVCQNLGLSARSLQQAFQQHTGQSPMAFLRDVRLDRVHAALTHADAQCPLSVSQVAAQYCFLHMGHFAANYRLRFGELPTQTLQNKARVRYRR